MKRFLVFFGSQYYPGGGMNDFMDDYDTLDEAIKEIEKRAEGDWMYYWGHIWDSETRIEVWYK